MYGLGGSFLYSDCSHCGSLFISETPPDLGRYYPADYYSYSRGLRPFLTAIYEDLTARVDALRHVRFLERSGVPMSAATTFIDVGSGSGDLLRALRAIGFPNGTGIDPFLPAETRTDGIRVVRDDVRIVAENGLCRKADVVMFHHSLEHVADPSASLLAASKLVNSDGIILVRIPIVSYAWERFGTKWVGLDAPRHLSLPTERGFAILATRLGLRIIRSAYDSTAMQFVASEAYERGLTLTKAFASNPPRTLLRMIMSTPKSLRAKVLNAQRRGDQAVFSLARERGADSASA
jgi:SAM-dependent methyltransferase